MSYDFAVDEPVDTAYVRCAREQLDRAIDELSGRIDEEPGRAVHDARKAMKKARSLLRLARGSARRRQRRSANATLQAAGNELSDARDSDVLGATLEQLSGRFAGQVPATTFDALEEHFANRAGGHVVVASSPARTAALEHLRSLRQEVDEWNLKEDGWKAIDEGLVRSYKRGRKAFHRARETHSLQDLHQWRKRVKDLWYQERLLTPICGRAVRGHAKDAHVLADLLGDDHDLGLLSEQLTERDIPVPVDVDAVIALIGHRREELQAEAFHIGERLYAEKPKAFRRRMRRSFDAGFGSAPRPSEQRPAELAAATRVPRHH